MAARRATICVLGLGEMGLIHARNLARVPGVDLSVASSRRPHAAAVAADLHAPTHFGSYDDALASPDVAGVVIATPPASHPALIKAAARAGKHIFSEKPLGYAVADILPAAAAVDAAGVRFMSGFMRRWDTGYAAAAAAVRAGDLGAPLVLKCTSGDPAYPEKYQRESSNNAMLLDLAVHDIDLARWLLGARIRRVYALTDALVYARLKELGDADVCVATLELEGGALATVHLSRALHYGYNVTSELVCARGTLAVGELKETPLVTIAKGGATTDVAPAFPDRFRAAFAAEMDAFAALVTAPEGIPAAAAAAGVGAPGQFPSLADGIEATAVAEALVASSRQAAPVEVVYP